MNQIAEELSTKKTRSLLIKQSIPASIGILIMSINMIVDTIFVGQWIGVLAIAAITVVLPIGFLISSVGMSIGIGGSSLISLALGAKKTDKAKRIFGNQIYLTTVSSIFLVTVCIIFQKSVLQFFGANGNIFDPATTYFQSIIIGVPFLAYAMMGNPIIRALGKPNYAMIALILPAVVNIILDLIFIKFLDLGIYGAGLASAISYAACGLFILGYLQSKKSDLKISLSYIKFEKSIVTEISSLGSITLVRQGAVSILTILLNYLLFYYGNETSVAIFGIINRLMMFIFFPIFGLVQGFLPIAGYNFGAGLHARVKSVLHHAITISTIICSLLFMGIYFFNYELTAIFTDDNELLNVTPSAILITLFATPLVGFQLIGAAYFQAVGKAKPALILTLLRQVIFLIPLTIILPMYFGLNGIWISFPISDLLASLITYFYVKKELNLLKT